MVDGLGLNSPGTRPAGHRGVCLEKEGVALSKAFWEEVDSFMHGMSKTQRLRLFSELALGRRASSPFAELLGGIRDRLDEVVVGMQVDPGRRPGDRPSEIAFRRLRAWAVLIGDADSRFLEDMASTGVSLGVRGEIPWVEPVYEKKDKRAEDFAPPVWNEDDKTANLRSNYSSARDHMEKVKRHIEADVEKGWMIRVPLAAAQEEYGEDLQVASLGGVPKDKEWNDVRVVHDGTHGLQVNTQIHQPNKMTFPQFDDVDCAMRALRSDNPAARALLAFDVKSAHRLIPIHRRDWGLQACRLDQEDEVLLNTRGTFGVASAAFWWGRVASLVFRVFHRLLPPHAVFYLLLFADDGLILLGGEEYMRWAFGMFLFLDLMEVPLSWGKTRGGWQVEWIGYSLDLKGWRIGISDKKLDWLRQWSMWARTVGRMLGREFKAGLGRMGFLAGAAKYARPFLAPLYASSARVPGGGFFELHFATKLAIRFFEEMVALEPMRPLSQEPSVLGEVFRVDAMADQTGIAIGGWETSETLETKEARWFHVKLDRKNAPYLYLKGEPFKTISTSELLAVTVAVIVFGQDSTWHSGAGRVSITGFTDNLSNAFLLDKFLTTKFPASLILMELACQLEKYKLDLSLAWVPREQNEPADDLSKGRFHLFDEGRRIEVDVDNLPFVVLYKLMDAAMELDEEVKIKKASKGPGPNLGKTPPEERLRLTQPW